jgi:hypothetical protein
MVTTDEEPRDSKRLDFVCPLYIRGSCFKRATIAAPLIRQVAIASPYQPSLKLAVFAGRDLVRILKAQRFPTMVSACLPA